MRKTIIIDDPREESFKFVMPLGRHYGEEDVNAWEKKVTVAVPHLNTIEPLKILVELMRLQTVKPYIMVVDTGSSPEVCDQLELMRAADLEIHYIRGHSYRHRSEPIAAAMDLAQSLCRTDYLFHTHADCFPRRRDLLEYLSNSCNTGFPVVGYRMSPRDWIKGSAWKDCVGHVACMLYMPQIHRRGLTWSMQRAYALGYGHGSSGWPDTETAFGYAMKKADITPLWVGFERNYERQVDDNIDHCRSFTGSKMHSPEYYEKAKRWMAEATREAMERIKEWRALVN